MNTLTLLVVLTCLVGVYSRHLEDRLDPDPMAEIEAQLEGNRKHGVDQSRHRRRRWQMNYGYEYPLPTHGFYPDNRRDYDRNQQDYFPRIVKLLEEISSYVKRPPLPPSLQPIYIPYPVPYPVQFSPCSGQGLKPTNITSRFPEMEDTNQNWGFVTSNDVEKDDDPNDGARPITFDPIKPLRPMKRPAPTVEHGSTQGDVLQPSTDAPKIIGDHPTLRTPNMCNAAILSCCTGEKQQQKICFDGFGCSVSYDNGRACSKESIDAALSMFQAAYSPLQ